MAPTTRSMRARRAGARKEGTNQAKVARTEVKTGASSRTAARPPRSTRRASPAISEALPPCVRIAFKNRGTSKAQIYAVPIDSGIRTWQGLQNSIATLLPNEERPFSITTKRGDIIHPSVWPFFIKDGLLVEVQASPPGAGSQGETRSIKLTLDPVFDEGDERFESVTVLVKPETRIGELLRIAASSYNKCQASLRLMDCGRRLRSDETVRACGLQDGDELWVLAEQVGGKPVITCYPATTMDVEVSLCLSSGLDFTYLHPRPHPLLTADVPYVRTAVWNVTAKPGGELFDPITGRTYAQLFWEATQLAGRSKDLCPIDTSMHAASRVFITTPDLFPTFMDDIMSELGFQVKERQEFVTYWGPQLLDHPFLLIKFLSPKEYASAAELCIKPTPDRLVRLFAVFRGVTEQDLEAMQLPRSASLEDEVNILLEGKARPTVGAGQDGFVVFEWGGMIA